MTQKIGHAVGRFGERLCLLCAVAFCALICLQNLKVIANGMWPIVIAGALFALAVVGLAINFWNLSDRATLIIMFALRFGIALAVILLIGAEPISDFKTMYEAAIDLAGGGRSYLDDIYFYNWAYQTGFVIYESLIIRIFGTGQLALQIMNAVWLGGIGALTYAIALRLMPKKAAAAASLLFALCPAPYFLAAVLTNQHIASFFIYLGIFLLVRQDKPKLSAMALAGASIAIGNVMRPIGIVAILAILCWGIIRLLMADNNKQRAKTLTSLLLVLICYFAIFSLCSSMVSWTGLNPEGLSNNQPTWKFVLGLNQETNGGWNREDAEAYLDLPTQEAGNAMQEVVKERLSVGPIALIKLAIRKNAVMWAELENMGWGFSHLDTQQQVGPLTVAQWIKAFVWGDKGVYLIAFILALIGTLTLLRKGTQSGPSLLLSFLLCGYCTVHLIIEVQVRYRYFLMPAVFLLAGIGLAWVLRWLSGRSAHRACNCTEDDQ